MVDALCDDIGPELVTSFQVGMTPFSHDDEMIKIGSLAGTYLSYLMNFQRAGGTGCYPPPSLHALITTFLRLADLYLALICCTYHL